ncbi:Z1 domain-containing protein [Alcanivorax sp.]|jgi:hypothetical protein|uniref:Z1 domain-containing protein n=1 Tax=Alcanivorax sp. TaxID=1872427 RepID=UPI0032D92AF2
MGANKRIKKLEDNLNMEIQHRGLTLEQAFDSVRDQLEGYFAATEAFEDLDQARKNVAASLQSIDHLTRVNAVRTRRMPWYSGPSAQSSNWDAYRSFLMEKGWENTIPSIDESSSGVVASLYNPGTPRYESRGLVLGYVQSGKTANMTAVIAKAADAGYKLVIILTGMVEKLRKQTQRRIESDLILRPGAQKWHRWTTEDADFTLQPTNPGFQFNPSERNILVVKKQKDVLQRIVEKLSNTSANTKNDTPVLIIDDECDQASINAAGRDNEITTLNRLIREIMNHLPRHSYVGYTATPFANVLIDPSVKPDEPLDLYPKDFIYTLPKPKEYFGAERLFGRDLIDAEEPLGEDEELDVIRLIPEEEIPSLSVSKDDPDFELTESAAEALDYFLLATAIRELRGQCDEHSTMLYHTSHLRQVHGQIAREVTRLLQHRRDMIEKRSSSYLKTIEDLLDREMAKVPPSLYGYEEPDITDLVPHLHTAVRAAEVVVVNSESDDDLDYGNAEGESGKRYIAVGGNVISRGLTLEGLVSSFFMRTSKQYDTLMQMGRWFGYRKGYEDLPRVWMTAQMQENFYRLATVEADIREKIRVYEQEEPDITPLDVAVKIRQIPGLAITARNKMRAARRCRFSFAGEHRQTTCFQHKNTRVLNSNWSAAELLVNQAAQASSLEHVDRGVILRGVDRELVETFLNSYVIHGKHADLVDYGCNANHLLRYISRRKQQSSDNLKYWNIGIVQPRGNRLLAETEIRGLSGLSLINRSMFQELVNGDADIKALMSRGDIAIDMDDYVPGTESWAAIKAERVRSGMNVPLLLLYPIDKDSAPAERTVKGSGKVIESKRHPLGASAHVMGMGILFPKVEEGDDEASHYVEVVLPEPEEADLSDEEELDEVSAS